VLILTRRIGETIIIGDNVSVNILGVKGNQVRVGIKAPKEIAVHRKEVFERIQAEKQRVQDVKEDQQDDNIDNEATNQA